MIEARHAIARSAVETWADALAELGDARWSVFEDVAHDHATVRGFFQDEAAARSALRELAKVLPAALGAEVRASKISFATIADRDWRESYKAHFKAWRCGTLHWVPEWQRATRKIPRRHAAVYLDPGLAFGTGNHETTRLCVQRLVEFVRPLTPTRRRALRVIDAGCGSGILAISAAKLGVEKILAFDNDAEAVAIARKNARRNGVASRVRCATGGVAGMLAHRRADLVLANIQADVLVRHARELIGAVSPGGALVLSGILAKELPHVRAAFRAVARDGRISSRRRGEWADLFLRRVR